MEPITEKKKATELSVDELEQLLADKKKAAQEEQEQKKQQYENERTALIDLLGNEALVVNEQMAHFKGDSFSAMDAFRQLMLEYGDIKGGENNKGNFEIKNDNFKIEYSSQVKMAFDERSEAAEEKLKTFLGGFVKKRDKKLYDLIMGLLERNAKTGALDISNINRLYKLEDSFEDENWKDAIRLFKESYNPTETAKYIRFYKKADNGGWDLINLNFSSI